MAKSKIVTRIKSGKNSDGKDTWVVGVEQDEKILAIFPCYNENQAEVIARAVESLVSKLIGQPHLGDIPPQGLS